MLIVRTDKTVYQPNETVLITMTLQNDTSSPQEYLFNSVQRFDVLIKQDGQKVWQYSDNRLFAQVVTKIVILPGDSRVFKAEWNQLNFYDEKTPTGIYTIHAGIVKHDDQRGSTVIELGMYG